MIMDRHKKRMSFLVLFTFLFTYSESRKTYAIQFFRKIFNRNEKTELISICRQVIKHAMLPHDTMNAPLKD